MMIFLLLFAFAVSGALAVRPLVIWHGMGDSYASKGMDNFMARIEDIHPGIFIHSIYVDQDLGKDKEATFYGNVNEQVESAAAQLAAIPQLQGGFDAIGFSQGGQFLRAYVERYNRPPVNNLITFGSQHMGVSDLPACRPYDFLCQLARQAAKSAVYGSWAQEHVVQAQYFRDPSDYEEYLTSNHFLTSINNEIVGLRNATYGDNLALLKKLVLVVFTKDTMVVPKESAWFGAEPIEEGDEAQGRLLIEEKIIPMRGQQLYVEDWIGLRRLDELGRIKFESCEGGHMQIGECWEQILEGNVGGSS
ncbi:palmitoyl-protein thioesterase [Amanita rubescens]|nr:palmitoyl-protein thioesterase [Amanita rubescens]